MYQELMRRAVTNPKIMGPLLISAVGSQNAEKIMDAYSTNKVGIDFITNILTGTPLNSDLFNTIVESPAGDIYAPDREQIEAERKFNEELNKPADVIPEEKKTTVDDVGFTEVKQDYEPLITLPPEFNLDQEGFTPAPEVKPSDYIMKSEEKKEDLKPNEQIFTKLAGVKNQNVERDPNDLFMEGWEKMVIAQPKQIGSLGDYAVAIDPMKRSDNNFLLVKDGQVHATLELATAMGQDKVLELDAIAVPVEMQGKGIAKDVLNELFKLADENGVTIQGIADPFGSKTLNKKQLLNFYKSMGFTIRGDEITRKPVITEESKSIVPPIDFNVIPENTSISVAPVSKKAAIDKGLSTNEGVYMANVDGKNVNLKDKTFNTANISVNPDGVPKFNVKNPINRDIEKVKGSKLTKVNLFKKSAGWKWLDKPETGNDSFLVSVEQGGKHYYTLGTNMTADTQLKYYPNEKSEPRLRPTAYDDLVLGNKVGEIDVRGKKHPVYDTIEVASPKQAVGADVTPKTVYSSQDSILKKDIRPVLSKDLLNPQYLKKLKEDDDVSCGQCYAASEAAFHMYGKENGFKSYVLNSKTFPEGLDKGDTHWFLKNKEGEIIDPTAEQFGVTPIPYEEGRGTGFLTKNPSKAALQIINRVEQNNAPILSGPEFVSNATKLKDKKVLISDVIEYLDSGKKRDIFNEEDYKAMLDEGVQEINYQLQQEVTGEGWYDEGVKKAMDIAPKINSKFADNPDLKDLLLFTTAIASSGVNVGSDFKVGLQVADIFADTGKIPLTNPYTGSGWTVRGSNLAKQLNLADSYIQENGLPAFLEFLHSDMTGREIQNFRKDYGNLGPSKGVRMDETYSGHRAFGPKIGEFMANLYGTDDNNVTDMWNLRGMNRLIGANMYVRDKDGNILTDKDGAAMENKGSPTPKIKTKFDQYMTDLSNLIGKSVRDTQAIRWYLEQGLYTALGVRSVPKDYGTAAEEVLKEKIENQSDGAIRSSKTSNIKNKTPTKKAKGGYIIPLPEIRML